MSADILPFSDAEAELDPLIDAFDDWKNAVVALKAAKSRVAATHERWVAAHLKYYGRMPDENANC